MNTNKNNHRLSVLDEIRFKIGLCLALCGVPLAMLLNFIIPIAPWSPVIMGASVLLLVDGFRIYRTIIRSKIITLVLLFQLMMMVYWLASSSHPFNYLSYHIFVFAFLFVILTNKRLRTIDCIPMLCAYSGVLSVICAVLQYFGFFSYAYWQALGIDADGERTLEVFTANIAAYTNLITCLMMMSKKNIKFQNLLFICLIIVDMYVIMRSAKRSYFVASMFAISYIAYKTKTYKRYMPHIIVALVVVIIAIPSVREMLVDSVERTISGFFDVYGSKKVEYDEYSSSAIRAYNLRLTIKDYNDFSPLEMVFGRGYDSFYIDNPLFQSYLDMGVLGFLFYSTLIVLYPLRCLWKNKIKNKYATTVLLLLLLHTFICVTNYNPYIYLPYPPLILLAVYNIKLRKKKVRCIGIKKNNRNENTDI